MSESPEQLAVSLLSTEANLLEMISSEAALPEILEKLTLAIESLSPGTIASVLLLDPDGKHLRHGAAPHLPQAYNDAVNGTEIGPAAGSCGSAAFCGAPIIVTDIQTDPLWTNYRDLAKTHNLAACWSTPIKSKRGKILGTFAMYYRQQRSPEQRDLKLIERATHIAQIAIECKQTELERERLLGQVQAAKRKIETILESVSDSFVSLDSNWIYTYVNEKAAQTFGRTPEQMVGKHIWTEFPEGIGQPFYKAYYRAMEEQKMISIEEYYIPYDKWFENRIYPHSGGISIFFHDITERKKMELALHESDRRFRDILETIQLLAFLIDLNGNITFCNDFVLSLTGYTRKELLGLDWFDTFLSGQTLEFKKKFQDSVSSGNIQPHFESFIVTKNGSQKLIRFSNTLLRNEAGDIIGTTSIGEDVTEHRRALEERVSAENKLREMQKDLELARQIHARTLPAGLPSIHRVSIEVQYVPLLAVGGDFYDFIQISETKMGILVADVLGHGLSAALDASTVRIAFKEAVTHHRNPPDVMRYMNQFLCPHLNYRFVSAVYAEIDTNSMTFRGSYAGHPPALLARSGQSIAEELIQSEGILLGVSMDSEYSLIEASLEEGDSIFLFTDGVFETFSASETESSWNLLKKCIQSLGAGPDASSAADILSEMNRIRNDTQTDDITLLSIRLGYVDGPPAPPGSGSAADNGMHKA